MTSGKQLSMVVFRCQNGKKMKVSDFDRRLGKLSETERRRLVEEAEELIRVSKGQEGRPVSRGSLQSEK